MAAHRRGCEWCAGRRQDALSDVESGSVPGEEWSAAALLQSGADPIALVGPAINITKKSLPLKRYLFDTGGTIKWRLAAVHADKLIALATPPMPSHPVGSPSGLLAGNGAATTAVGLIVLMRISLPLEKTATKHCNAAGFDAWRIEK